MLTPSPSTRALFLERGPVCKTFFADEELRARTRVDGVLTVVDAVHFLQQLSRVGGSERLLWRARDTIIVYIYMYYIHATIYDIDVI